MSSHCGDKFQHVLGPPLFSGVSEEVTTVCEQYISTSNIKRVEERKTNPVSFFATIVDNNWNFYSMKTIACEQPLSRSRYMMGLCCQLRFHSYWPHHPFTTTQRLLFHKYSFLKTKISKTKIPSTKSADRK